MQLTVHYFALLKEQRGRDSETLSTEAATPQALYQELSTQYGFTLPQSALQVAVNDDFAGWSQTLVEGDSLAFIPPVAGG